MGQQSVVVKKESMRFLLSKRVLFVQLLLFADPEDECQG
jgi:hypothetical protein